MWGLYQKLEKHKRLAWKVINPNIIFTNSIQNSWVLHDGIDNSDNSSMSLYLFFFNSKILFQGQCFTQWEKFNRVQCSIKRSWKQPNWNTQQWALLNSNKEQKLFFFFFFLAKNLFEHQTSTLKNSHFFTDQLLWRILPNTYWRRKTFSQWASILTAKKRSQHRPTSFLSRILNSHTYGLPLKTE